MHKRKKNSGPRGKSLDIDKANSENWEVGMGYTPLVNDDGHQYVIEYAYEVEFPLFESAIRTCEQVYDIQGAPKTDERMGSRVGKRGAKSVDELDGNTLIQRLARWVAGQYGYDEYEIGYIDPEQAMYVVMGELQLDHIRLAINTESERGAEKMENLQTRQTARVAKVVKTVAGPSETKEKPAPRTAPPAKVTGNGKGKAAPPTVKAPTKTTKTETKQASGKKAAPAKSAKAVAKPAKAATKAAPKAKVAKPAKTVTKGNTSAGKKAATAKPVQKAVKKAVAVKRQGVKIASGTKKRETAPKAQKAVAKGRQAQPVPGPSTGGRTAENQAAIQYVRDGLAKGWAKERIVNGVESQRRFAGTPVSKNPMKAIYRQQSEMYKDGTMRKPEGSRGRPAGYTPPPKKRGRK